MEIKWIGSPFFTKGRGSKKVEMIVVHWIVGSLESCDATFNRAGRNASSHYGVGDLDVHQYVKEEDTAWHAGVWKVNQRSVGIENEGSPSHPVTQDTYHTTAQLMAEICIRHGLIPSSDTIKPHREFAATQCPGTLDMDYVIKLTKQYYDAAVNPAEPVEPQPAPEPTPQPPAPETPPATALAKTHTVQKGENLWNIVKQEYGLTSNADIVKQLEIVKQANPELERGKNWDLIYPGDVVRLP